MGTAPDIREPTVFEKEFRRLDVNSDGALGRSETFSVYGPNAFEDADKDGDECVSLYEWEVWRTRQMKEQFRVKHFRENELRELHSTIADYVELSVSNIVSPSNPSVVVSGSIHFECMGCSQGLSAGGWTWGVKGGGAISRSGDYVAPNEPCTSRVVLNLEDMADFDGMISTFADVEVLSLEQAGFSFNGPGFFVDEARLAVQTLRGGPLGKAAKLECYVRSSAPVAVDAFEVGWAEEWKRSFWTCLCYCFTIRSLS